MLALDLGICETCFGAGSSSSSDSGAESRMALTEGEEERRSEEEGGPIGLAVARLDVAPLTGKP